MTTSQENSTHDRALEAYLEMGATLPVEYGTEGYDRLREIAGDVGSMLVKSGSDEATAVRKEVAALVVVSSAVNHYPVLVNNPDAAGNPDVDAVLIELIDAGVTDVDSFFEDQDPTKFDESDDKIEMMIDGLKGVAARARQYNEEVKKGIDGITPVVMDIDSGEEDQDISADYDEDGDYDDVSEDQPLVEDSEDDDEIEGSTF